MNLAEEESKFTEETILFDQDLGKHFPYLSDDQTGTYLKTCGHYVHFKCLNDYKINSQQQRSMRMFMADQMAFEEFQCPLCKQFANILLPCPNELNALMIAEDPTLASDGDEE